MSVKTTAPLTIPSVGAVGTVATSATSADASLAINGFGSLADGTNLVIGIFTTVASNSVSFMCLEVRQGAAGNTLASGASVVKAANPGNALASALGDIDLSTFGAGKVLVATASNGKTYSFADAPVVLTGNQTIAGIKTFSTAPVMSGASITAATIPASALAAAVITALLPSQASHANKALLTDGAGNLSWGTPS